MQFNRIVYLATAGAMLAVTAPLTAQSATPGQVQTQGPRHPHGHGGKMFAGLNLTDAQRAQIKAIHEKYKGQLGSARAAAKPDFEAARAARQRGDTAAARAAFARARDAMKASQPVRQQEMAEIRNVLTPEQRQQLDAKKAQWKEQHKGQYQGKRQGQGRRTQ